MPARLLLPAVVSLLVLGLSAEAVILYRTSDPSANTTAPSSTFPRSGWDYVGTFGSFQGTPIAPNFFITAAHVGNAGVITFGGTTYPVLETFADPATDLAIHRINGTFPVFAPLYTGTDEAGDRAVAIGRGTQRGGELSISGTPKGWAWGPHDTPGGSFLRWGENMINRVISSGSAANQLLVCAFDAGNLPEECHLSSGDSGGPLFLEQDGVWKLAGIHYAVDSVYAAADPDSAFNAALYDMRGYYHHTAGQFVQFSGAVARPSSFYSTRISNRLPWICSVVANPRLGLEGNFATLTYTRLKLPPNELTYVVEASSDLVAWGPATVLEEQLSSTPGSEVIKAKVDRTNADRLYLRLRFQRP